MRDVGLFFLSPAPVQGCFAAGMPGFAFHLMSARFLFRIEKRATLL